ncbi:hypothetical protein [uncultured Microbacterium sp.]|uniref:hypothetical protein n=1 Tax=uncultured Microbacterium sp. TaxID=191216 RepID=UPI0025EA164E|nr:hypothetical protein [uncultured Microbacterium sp.]
MTAPEVRRTGLTPAMRAVLIGVLAVVVVGVAIAVWFWVAGPGAGSAAPAPTATVAGPRPGATPTSGSEVRPPTATPGTGLPPLSDETPLVKAPLPASGSADGAVVAGFPENVLGPLPGSTLGSTSIATEGTRMQATLIASSTSPEDDIRAHYQQLWAGLGLHPETTSDGTLSFTGAYESVTLAISSSGTGNRYTLSGVFRTE